MWREVVEWYSTAERWVADHNTTLLPLGVAIALIWNAARSRKKRFDPQAAAMVAGLRMQAFEMTPAEIGITPEPQQPFMIMMDIALNDGSAFLLATAAGDASLYLSNGGAVLGGSEIPGARELAQKWVRQAADHRNAYSRGTYSGYPEPGYVRFYVRTPEETYVMRRRIDDLITGTNELSSLFVTGNQLLAQLRAPR